MLISPTFNSYFNLMRQAVTETPTSLAHVCSASAAAITYAVTRALIPTKRSTSAIDAKRQEACSKTLIFLNNLRLLPTNMKHSVAFTRKQYQSIYDTLTMFAPKISSQLPYGNDHLENLLSQIKNELTNTESASFEFPLITDDLYAALRACWYLMLRDSVLNGVSTKGLPSFPNFLENHPKLDEVKDALQRGAQSKSTWTDWIPLTAAATVALVTEAAFNVLQSDDDTREQHSL